MAHVMLPEGLPGIIGPVTQYPETGEPMRDFVNALMRGESSLTLADRELIATYVSSLNSCRFCTNSHGATAAKLLGDGSLVTSVIQDPSSAPISDKLKALLVIAAKVQQGGRRVDDRDVSAARSAGADDKAIHDTVLVAAAFCMFNRYVDGLDTDIPDESIYEAMGARLAGQGYVGG
jgi:uncharacterized peroxidase-related enzyme